MEFILPLLLVFAFFYLRRVWYDKRKVPSPSSIDRITLCRIEPDIISPEVKVRYKYYFDNGIYFGKCYMLITDFFGEKEFKLYLNNLNMPVLEIDNCIIVSEEHIEQYLLKNQSNVLIYLDPVEPFHSEIIQLDEEKVKLGL